MLNNLRNNRQALICAATGNSPTGAYRQLVTRKDSFDSSGLRFIKLDEWAGLPMDHPGSANITCGSIISAANTSRPLYSIHFL